MKDNRVQSSESFIRISPFYEGTYPFMTGHSGMSPFRTGCSRSGQDVPPKLMSIEQPLHAANPENATVPVNKKFTFRFKKTIVLRLTVLSKNGTTTERKRNGHAIRKRNGTYKKTERNVLRTVYTVHNTHEV